MRFRNSAKAIIIKDNKLLAIEKMENGSPWYLLPGGGQEFGETLIEALKRECLEEIGAEVEVGKMILSREYIGKNHEFYETDFDFHQVEFYFYCSLISDVNECDATKPDNGQTGIRWISLDDSATKLYPKFLLNALKNASEFIYHGDKN